MYDARNVSKQCQHDINPEVANDADVQKHTERRQKNGNDDRDEIGGHKVWAERGVTMSRDEQAKRPNG